jgi:general secretion pathway protein I
MRHPYRRKLGFTLLEVLVASTIMAIAVGTIFSTLSTSLRTASRITERDQAALQAQRILEDLLADTTVPRGNALGGHLSAAQTGIEADWRAQVNPIESAPGGWVVDRVAVEVRWGVGGRPGAVQLEGYRTARVLGQ